MTPKENFNKSIAQVCKDYCIAMYRTYGGVFSGASRESFDAGNNNTVRSGYWSDNYDYFRRHEEIPKSIKGRIDLCMKIYEHVFVVRNLIDTMEDFTVQGIRITHPNKSVQQFFESWARRSNFYEVSARIVNLLYRAANVPIKITTGKIPPAKIKEWRKGNAKKSDFNTVEYENREIPIHYELLNPMQVEVVGEFSSITGKKKYGQRLKEDTVSNLVRNKHSQELATFSDSFFSAIQRNKGIVPLNEDKFEILFYKKDDWNDFALPFSSSVLSNLSLLEKMHLADKSALDGAINQVRLWTLGNFEHRVPPSPEAIRRLRNLLANVGNGNIDIIWGPELSFNETSTQVHQFLGSEKYKQVMIEIYNGLGIPPSLTGSTTGNSGGFTNTSISMKTLIERLEYGRRILVSFWTEQFRRICAAMGNNSGIWSVVPKVTFDYKVLSDERAEIELLLKLYDRHLVSDETVQELSRRDPEIELARLQKENKERLENKRPEKATPFHDPRWEDKFRQIFAQQGLLTPSELGLELFERKNGEETFVDINFKQQKDLEKFKEKKSQNDGGRPDGAKDSKKRKQKEVKTKEGTVATFANIFIWANQAQEDINKLVTPLVLQASGKKNIRSLSKHEYDQYESMKFTVLSKMDPFLAISEENVYPYLKESNSSIDSDVLALATMLLLRFNDLNKREPNIEEKRQIQSTAYAIMKCEDLNENQS